MKSPFSYGFPMVFLWFSATLSVKTRDLVNDDLSDLPRIDDFLEIPRSHRQPSPAIVVLLSLVPAMGRYTNHGENGD
jgi:hypothetical protein